MEPLGATLAERFQLPCVHAWWTPMLAARDFLFASSETAPPRLPGWANRAVFLAFDQAPWLTFRRALRPPRALYELPAAPYTLAQRRAVARCETLLLAYSEALLPRSREWPANVETTGWRFLEDGASWTPPSELERFLAAGPTPTYVGFGSMAFREPDARRLTRSCAPSSWRARSSAPVGADLFAVTYRPPSSRSTRRRTTGCFHAWRRSSITAGPARQAPP